MKKILALFVAFVVVGCNVPGQSVSSALPEDNTSSGGEVAVVPVEPSEEQIEQPRQESDRVPVIMSAPSGEERIVGLNLGTPAPFSGVLLNAAAAAWLESEPDVVQERCQLFVNRRVGELRAQLLSETQSLQLQITSLTQIHAVELRNRDAQIASLSRINDELRSSPFDWWEQVLWVGGALIIGAALGIIFALVAN